MTAQLPLPPPPGWPFAGLAPASYGVIMADPPWAFRLFSDKGDRKSPQAHYACMGLDAINALPVREHSRKPDDAYDQAERLYPGPRAELFSRQRRPGWDAWGNETDKFEEAA